jgi:Terminase large subunit, T4likevirus-type, N-terminal/Terminase RNaseH-like domain
MLTAKEIARASLKRAGYKVREDRHALDLPTPTADQQGIINHPARFKVLACGRRWGKTVIDIRVLAEKALAGETWGYFSMTYRNLAECFRELKIALEPYTLRSSQTEGRIELHNGGLLEFWSLQTTNKDTARGRKYHGVVLDEAAFIPNGDYVWNSVIRPTLADLQGAALLTSSTNGRNHFFEWYQRGEDKIAYPDWESWSFPSSANPLMTADELESIRQETPDLYFRQEYMAEFLEGEGAVFRRIGENAILDPAEPIPGHQYIFGVDWAMKNDFTVIVVMDKNTREMVALDRFNRVDWALQRGRLTSMADKWKPIAIHAESNSIGSPNIEALQYAGLPVYPFETTASSKPPLIESLVLAFERDEIKVLNNPTLKGELMAYERKVSPTTGRSQYSAPEGMHDDTVVALALAWWGALGNGRGSLRIGQASQKIADLFGGLS